MHARRKEILFVGRIHPEKGLHLLIEAFLHISPMKRKEWRLVIVGSTEFNTGGGGPGYREAILGRAALLGDKIDWVGPVYESIKLNEFYRRASLFVYPSLAERGETFGLAPLEAMSNGCPALVSNLRCFRENLDAEVDGFVFDHRVQEPSWELAKRIEELIENPSVLIAASAAGLVKARGFSLPRVAQMFLDDFDKLLPRSPSAS